MKLMLQENNKKNKKKTFGATLFEMLVYMALFGMVFTGIYMVFSAAIKYYYVTQANVWIQQGSLTAINQLSREMLESSLNSVVLYSSDPKGIVFMSPRTLLSSTPSPNVISYNTSTGYEGKVYWQKYVAYYLYTDPNDSSKKAVFRKEITAPTAPANSPSSSGTYTTSYFATGAGTTLPYKIVAYNITDFDLYWLDSSSVKTYGTPTLNPIHISVTAQDNSKGKSNTITTESSMDVMNY